MTRGRKPKPTAIKKLEGNPGKRKLSENEPKFKTGAPPRPTWLTGDAKKEWERITPILEGAGLLTHAEKTGLEAYCQLYSRWVRCEKDLKKEGLIVTTANGTPMQNPLIGISNTCLERLKFYLSEFGLTPSSRTRLIVNMDPESDEFDNFLEQQDR